MARLLYSLIFQVLSPSPSGRISGSAKLARKGVTETYPFDIAQPSDPKGTEPGAGVIRLPISGANLNTSSLTFSTMASEPDDLPFAGSVFGESGPAADTRGFV